MNGDAEWNRWRGGVDQKLTTLQGQMRTTIDTLNGLESWRIKLATAIAVLTAAISTIVSILTKVLF